MINPFEIADKPSGHPTSIIIGSYASWWLDFTFSDAVYTLKYVLRSGATTIEVPATYVDGKWTFTVPGATSGAWTAGSYAYDLQLVRISDSQNAILESGFIAIVAANSDRRSHAQVMLGKIESLLAGRADADVSSYTIKSRSLTKLTTKELLDWRNYYREEVAREANGGRIPKIKVRFTG